MPQCDYMNDRTVDEKKFKNAFNVTAWNDCGLRGRERAKTNNNFECIAADAVALK